jgi:UDP-N-acetylmuramate--alanine ligase
MSALALYFAKGGFTVAGYDRSESRISLSLVENGCEITYEDEIGFLPDLFKDKSGRNKVIVVYTPAIPAEN